MASARATVNRRFQGLSVWPLYVVGLAPALWYFWQGASGRLGADPVKTFELILGLWAFRFLVLTLAVSPLRDLAGLNMMRFRRALGLLCFWYALFHFTVYLVLDQQMRLGAVWEDVSKRPFIMLGMTALLALVPLAVTSNRFFIRKLGPKWRSLHKLVYVAALCAGVHFFLATKVLNPEQILYLALIVVLLASRSLLAFLKRRRRPAKLA